MNMNMNMSSYSLPLPPPPPPTAHAVLTKSDLAASQQAYADLLTTAKSYRVALAALSTAASTFGSALEACARLKEARADSLSLAGSVPGPGAGATTSSGCTADALLSAAGVHHLVANHEQILSETVYRSFEVPLLHELDKWRRAVDDEEAAYLASVRRQSADIRRLEKEGLRLHRQRGPRDVAKFRGHLVELTTRLDGLTALHGDHARTLLRESQDTSVKILEASCSLVRAEVDIFESLARKGWSGGGLDDLLEKGTDLFAAEEDPTAGYAGIGPGGGGVGGGGADDPTTTKLFSILPPKSILADAALSDAGGVLLPGPGMMTAVDRGRTSGGAGHARADSLGVVSEPYQSLAGAVTVSPERRGRGGDLDAASIFSADFSPAGRPRMTRPFSPQPVRVRTEDVLGEDEDEGEKEKRHRRRQEEEEEGRSDSDDDEDGPSSPETVRDVEEGAGLRADVALAMGDEDDEHPWDDEGKRMSTAASDPDERERRWNTTSSDDE